MAMEDYADDRWISRQELTRSIRTAGQDTGRVGVQGHWPAVRQVRPTREIPHERRDRLGKSATDRRPARKRLIIMVR
jgi:hypothetical protein